MVLSKSTSAGEGMRLYPEQFTLVDGGEGGKHLHYVTGSRRVDDYLYGKISIYFLSTGINALFRKTILSSLTSLFISS